MRQSLMAGFRRRSWELDFAPTMKASDCKTLNENKIPSGEIYTGGDFVMAQKIWMLNPNLHSRKFSYLNCYIILPAEIQCYFSALFSSSFFPAPRRPIRATTRLIIMITVKIPTIPFPMMDRVIKKIIPHKKYSFP